MTARRHRVADVRDAVLDRLGRPATRYVPAGHDVADDFRDRFPASARAFRAFLRRARHLGNGSDGPAVAVVVMPWFGTPVPWFAIATGLGLAGLGRRVTFVLHDLPVAEDPAFHATQIAEMDAALDLVRDRFPVVRVGAVAPGAPPTAADEAVIDDLAAQILVWTSRGDAHPRPAEVAASERTRAHLRTALPWVRAAVEGLDAEYLVVPGGVLVASGLFVHAGRGAGRRVATFDAGLGWSVVSADGVAAQQTDVSRAVRMLEDEAGPRTDAIVAEAQAAFAERRAGTDAMAYQVASPTGAAAVDGSRPVLIPLSVMFDTAALGRSHLYADAAEWLAETVRVLLEETTDPILVRQHPSERRAAERGRFDPVAILADALGETPRVEVVLAEDDRNTYDLLDDSRLVIPYVSTIGIEAAALGHPVILGGNAYYGDLGFTWAPPTRAEYEDAVRRGARGELAAAGRTTRAWLCYYLNAVTARTWTDFTPQPTDFWRWVVREPDELFGEDAVVDLFTALDADVPLCLVRHRRRVAEGAV